MRISYSLQAIGQKVADILIASGLNVASWAGSTVATPNVAGYPLVDTRYHRGTLENALVANRRDAYVGAALAGAVPTIKSIQYFTIVLGAGVSTNTATLGTAVDTSKTFLIHLGTTGSNAAAEMFNRITLTNTTTVTAVRAGSTADSVTTGGVAVECY